MKVLILLLIGLLTCQALACQASAFGEAQGGSAEATTRLIEDFSQDPPGKFPIIFKTYPLQRTKALKVYRVEGEGHHLHADDVRQSGTVIFRHFPWRLDEWPILTWRWRALILPQGADFNDTACSIYIVFGGYGGKSLKYLWSSTLPPETTVETREGRLFSRVVESGPSHSNQWRQVSVTIAEDFKLAFHTDEIPEPKGIGILTDSDDTHSRSACDYDDFRLEK